MAQHFRGVPTNETHLKRFLSGRNKRLRDYQRSKVYEWDRVVRDSLLADTEDLTENECASVINEAWDVLGLTEVAPAPSIEITPQKKSYSTYYRVHGKRTIPQHHIRLAESWGGVLSTVLHETAHAILSVVDTVEYSNHREAFVSVLRDLYRMWHPYQDDWADCSVFSLNRWYTKGDDMMFQKPCHDHAEADLDYMNHVANVIGVNYSQHTAFSVAEMNQRSYHQYKAHAQ
jgi:hypothetical protein